METTTTMTKPKYTAWNEVPLVLRTKDVADVLGVHINTVKKLITDGKIPARKVGRAYRVTKEDLKQYVESED